MLVENPANRNIKIKILVTSSWFISFLCVSILGKIHGTRLDLQLCQAQTYNKILYIFFRVLFSLIKHFHRVSFSNTYEAEDSLGMKQSVQRNKF